tara:strand:- start:1774 stop:3078 length:1305 start_codon:yes stop_codon:yes gene_type:complete
MKFIKKFILNFFLYFNYKISKINIKQEKHIKIYEEFNYKLSRLEKDIKKTLSQFFKSKKLWQKKLPFPLNNFEILPSNIFIGAFGNYGGLLTLLMANKNKLRKEKKLISFVPDYLKNNNSTLRNYFSDYVHISPHKIYSDEFIKEHQIDTGTIIEFDKFALRLFEAKNLVEQRRKNNKGFLKLKKDHLKNGISILRKMGVKNNEKFITLHIRQLGWRGENISNSTEIFRTPNVENYIQAIEYLTKLNFKVILVGNNNYKFKKIKNFINYANSKFKSDSMDIFLAAKSEFLIGNASGFYNAAMCFGTPVLFTDVSCYSNFFFLSKNDLFLPRLLKRINSKKIIPIINCFDYPLNSIHHDNHLKKLSITVEENSPSDITEAVKEMLKNILKKKKDSLVQKKFKKTFNNHFDKDKSKNLKLKAIANIPSFFLKKYFN